MEISDLNKCQDEEVLENTIERKVIECGTDSMSVTKREREAYKIRKDAALYQRKLPNEEPECNEDEYNYSNKMANYSKTMPHNCLGEVDIDAYNVYIEALKTGDADAFEKIPLGGITKLIDPLSAYSYDLIGADSHHLSIRSAPEFSGAETASEMAEDYWLALTKDILFSDYDTCDHIYEAAKDLSEFTEFKGPREDGKVTSGTIFRGNAFGCLDGPYISQFLCQDIPFGAKKITQKYHVPKEGNDFMTSYNNWLDIQNGELPSQNIDYNNRLRFIRNGRDMAEFVHQDFSYQGTLTACLILLSYGRDALADSNPYFYSNTMDGFATFGHPHILDFVSKVSALALKAAWYQKYLVHRRLRPEEFGGRVHNYLSGKADYPINEELLKSNVLSKVFDKYNSYLLPMAYPEGCPAHTAYPSGHATFTGAGVTILKAFFNEDYVIPYPVVASSNGLKLFDYCGNPLTVGGELNKLAANIAIGRNFAGVHYRSDGEEGMKLGEQVAIGMLRDCKYIYREKFDGFTLTKFDGTKIKI